MSKTMATKFWECFPLTDENEYTETENYETHEQAWKEIAEWIVEEGWNTETVPDEGTYITENGVRIYALVASTA